MKFTKANILWWKLFPIEIGDTVKVISGEYKNKVGKVFGMTVPVSHEKDPAIEYFERTTYDLLFGKFKRWEIEKIE